MIFGINIPNGLKKYDQKIRIKKMAKLNNTIPTCPKCGRKNILYRIRTNTFLCRTCGNIWHIKKKGGKNG
jgi:ribosomal protein L37AE/L43A